jgi:hypothetical protein
MSRQPGCPSGAESWTGHDHTHAHVFQSSWAMDTGSFLSLLSLLSERHQDPVTSPQLPHPDCSMTVRTREGLQPFPLSTTRGRHPKNEEKS